LANNYRNFVATILQKEARPALVGASRAGHKRDRARQFWDTIFQSNVGACRENMLTLK
jgi:hypothetical protein